MNYRYEAVDRSGRVVRGVMDAADEQAVAQRLNSMGFSLKSIVQPGAATQQTAATFVAAPPAQARAARPPVPVSIAPVVSIRSLSRFYRQLATMIRAGMPVLQSLIDLEGATHDGRLRRAARELSSHIQQGDSLSAAMARYPKLFPVHTVGLIWSGELGGYLDVSLDEAATELEQERKDGIWASVGWIVAYINIVSLIMCLPMLDIQAFITKVTAISAQRGITGEGGAPSMDAAKAVLGVVVEEYMKGFVHTVIPILLAWLVAALIWKRLKRLPEVRMTLDRLLLYMPNWGTLHRERGRQRFLKSLFHLYQAGVAPAQAWSAASMTVRNSELSQRLRIMEETLRRSDGNLQTAMVGSGVFQHEDANMVGTGERSGSVPEMLQRLSEYHADVAGSSKLKGRLISVHALILGLILASGYVTIKCTAGVMDYYMSVLKGFGY